MSSNGRRTGSSDGMKRWVTRTTKRVSRPLPTGKFNALTASKDCQVSASIWTIQAFKPTFAENQLMQAITYKDVR